MYPLPSLKNVCGCITNKDVSEWLVIMERSFKWHSEDLTNNYIIHLPPHPQTQTHGNSAYGNVVVLTPHHHALPTMSYHTVLHCIVTSYYITPHFTTPPPLSSPSPPPLPPQLSPLTLSTVTTTYKITSLHLLYFTISSFLYVELTLFLILINRKKQVIDM